MVEQRTVDAAAVVTASAEELRAAVGSASSRRNVKRTHAGADIAIATEVIEPMATGCTAMTRRSSAPHRRPARGSGHQKALRPTRTYGNFGMPHLEGYRKAIRLFRLAERLNLPVVTFIDTPGAFPGPASEERGVAEAIARAIMVMTGLRTPIVTVITGEGGSGGALALAVGDVVLALENSIYSVISPEGAASILWRSPESRNMPRWRCA
jgi:hypothetical protein